MTKQILLNRLTGADPGWPVYRELVARVESVDFAEVHLDYLQLGRFLVAPGPLVFGHSGADIDWPDWLPRYVPALFGIKAAKPEYESGYAGHFRARPAQEEAVFSPAGNDQQLGYPRIDVAADTYPFQANRSGAFFFVNPSQQILYPSVARRRLEVLDSLAGFTQRSIRAALDGQDWFRSYAKATEGLID